MADFLHVAQLAVVFLFCLAVLYGAFTDISTYTIPNRVSYGLLLLFAPYAALHWQSLPVLHHVGLGVFVTVLCIVFWKLRWFGGGDAKFVGAISFWMGPQHILLFTILLALISLALVTALRIARQWNDYIQAGTWPKIVKGMVQKAEENAIPYGLPAAMAALIALVPEALG